MRWQQTHFEAKFKFAGNGGFRKSHDEGSQLMARVRGDQGTVGAILHELMPVYSKDYDGC